MALNVTKTGITGRNKLKGNIKACFGSNPIKNPKKSRNHRVKVMRIDKNVYFYNENCTWLLATLNRVNQYLFLGFLGV